MASAPGCLKCRACKQLLRKESARPGQLWAQKIDLFSHRQQTGQGFQRSTPHLQNAGTRRLWIHFEPQGKSPELVSLQVRKRRSQRRKVQSWPGPIRPHDRLQKDSGSSSRIRFPRKFPKIERRNKHSPWPRHLREPPDFISQISEDRGEAERAGLEQSARPRSKAFPKRSPTSSSSTTMTAGSRAAAAIPSARTPGSKRSPKGCPAPVPMRINPRSWWPQRARSASERTRRSSRKWTKIQAPATTTWSRPSQTCPSTCCRDGMDIDYRKLFRAGDHFLGLRSESHLRATSSLFWLLAEMLKVATVLSLRAVRSMRLMISAYFSAPYRSFLFPSTSSGIPARLLLLSKSWSCALATSMLAAWGRGYFGRRNQLRR